MPSAGVATRKREQFDDEHRCTEFTADHGLDTTENSDVLGAFVCQHCETVTPLTGDPADFREVVLRCMGCTRVQILDSTALAAFLTGAADA